VHALTLRALELLGLAPDLAREKVVADDRFIGPGYGLPTEGMIEAVQMLARTEGILIDPVYTGKGLAGMISMVRAGKFMHDEDVIFIHTGGAAALFGYRWAFGQS
jgi:L-cysteate sulfo-lyase